MYAVSAAHKTLPLGTYVRVHNLNNNKKLDVRINDRGPFAPNRIIDLSYAAAVKLGYEKKGTALVQVSAMNLRNPYATPPVYLGHKPKLFLQLGAFRDYANAEQFMKTRGFKYMVNGIIKAR